MDKISGAIKCIDCKQVVRSPVIIPCGHSVCKHHTSGPKKFACSSCGLDHSIPIDGFPPNKALEAMISAEIHELDLGNEHKQALELCNQLNDEIQKLKLIFNEPAAAVHDRLSVYRNRIDLKREMLKLAIDDHADKLLHNINEFELKQKDVDVDFKSRFKEVEDKLRCSIADHDKWLANLNRLKVDIKEYEKTRERCFKRISSLKEQTGELEKHLIADKLNPFERQVLEFEKIEIFKNSYDQIDEILKPIKFEKTRSSLDEFFGLSFLARDSDVSNYNWSFDFESRNDGYRSTIEEKDEATSFFGASSLREIESKGSPVGIYRSRGSANGRMVFQGPRGGLYYINSSGVKTHVKPDSVLRF